MKLASRKAVSVSQQRRNDLLAERARAAAMRDLYPDVEQLKIALVFDDGSLRTPSPQSHTFFPAARAFFRFTCPCTDCDGDFDLREPVRALVTSAPAGKRGTARTAKGKVRCEGIRLRDRVGSRPCDMTVDYRLAASAAE